MDSFRKFGETKFSKAMLLLLVVCFGAWGIGGYLMPNIGAAAVTVNGEGISPQTLKQTYDQRLQNVSQLLGTKPTQEQIDQMQLPEQVVTEVVARTVLRQTAEKLGFLPATQQVRDEISMVSAFKDAQGKFDSVKYGQILQQIGRSKGQFEHDLGQDIIVRQLALLSKVELTSPSLVAQVSKAEDVHLTLDVATFKPELLGAISEPTKSEIDVFYKDNGTLYSKAEARDLVVLRVSKDDLVKSITVPEKDIQKAYDDNKAAYVLPEKRVVRHILLDSKADAEKAALKIKTLTEFEREANAVTKDPGNQGKGGLLGSIEEKDVVPAFGKVAFKLAENTLSAPVQSNFGWHLIWVEKIEPKKDLTFDEVKDAIARDLQASQADEALERLTSQVDTKVAGGEALMKIAADVGLKPVQYNMVNAKDEAVEPQELAAGFGVAKGDVSVPLTMKDGGVAYVQAVEIYPAKVLPLAEVVERVKKDWKNARIQTELRTNADKLLAIARAPKAEGALSAQAAKASVGGVTTEKLVITKPDEAPEWLQRNLLELYPLKAGGVLATAMKDGENWRVVRLERRDEVAPAAETLPELAKIYQQRMQGDVEALLMSYVTQQARVKLNQEHLKQLFGRDVQWAVTE